MANHDSFLSEIKTFLPADRIFTDELRTLAWGTDAGFYRLIPKIVVITQNEEEVVKIMELASRLDVPVTFRAAGTSLSGQAITDSVLLVAGKSWENYVLSHDKSTITLQPGILGGRVNEILAPFGLMFSPDPASKDSAMVGGIIANNASGMNCGTHANSDQILRTIRIVLSDGTVLDTGDESSKAAFRNKHPEILEEIAKIRDEVRADESLADRIRQKYAIKNVTGLNLLPFVTYDEPFDIITHLMVGSEGTLAFISEATVATAHLYPLAASAMLYFDSMEEACRCVVDLKSDAPVFSCEMLDKKSLASVNDTTGKGLTALLIDTKADTEAELSENIAAIKNVVDRFKLFRPVEFSSDVAVTGKWWRIRSGVFPAVGGTRPTGTTALIEDIAFHINDLPRATAELVEILNESGYDDACIYGHALEGNYHFIISQSFKTDEEVERYKKLMERIEHLVVDRYDGSLKAEHGVGRNMAPFIHREWGEKAWSLMQRIKKAFDPREILNRGSMFNDDAEIHIKNFKPIPTVNPLIDKCIECGFCEHNCVSCGLTLSARQRIVIYREIVSLKADGSPEALERAHRLEKEFKYFGNQTCAGDGLCSTSCPMGINTGELIHEVREAALPRGSFGYKAGALAARKLATVEGGLRIALDMASLTCRIIGDRAVDSIGKGLHKVGFPLWTSALPGAFRLKEKSIDPVPSDKPKVVYFPSCINQTMGVTPEKGKKISPQVEVIMNLCRKAGFEVIFPEDMAGLCCGMIWESKGMPELANEKTLQLEKALLKASENGKYPVLCDQSPCLHRMRRHIRSMKLYEPVEFITRYLAPRLKFIPDDTPVAIHITCSSRLMGLGKMMEDLARRCSTRVLVPAEVGCCGFAGDRGFTVPELNKWGLRKLKPQIEAFGATEGYSNSRTCEIGLTSNSGIPYKSIAYLVDKHTLPND